MTPELVEGSAPGSIVSLLVLVVLVLAAPLAAEAVIRLLAWWEDVGEMSAGRRVLDEADDIDRKAQK